MGGIVTSLTQAGEVDRRLAVRIRVRVSGDLEPSMSVDDLKIHYSGTANPFGAGDATITYTIHNTGNAILAARPSTSVSAPFTTIDADQTADTPQLLPGETWKITTTVHGVRPVLRLTGKITLLPLLTDAAGSTGTLDTITATTHAWTVPWLVLLVLVCAAAVALTVVRRRRSAIGMSPSTSLPHRTG
jgi:hypothetical protein